ncbi:hypothetical protein CO178_01265 [candidate division WWE3 bacterium CG_4_9_14_3_um_filter_34_6]|uniref:Peptidase S11 D-alanyl-D-alanine carboxypeptidase A N-terminal domain-containing protein n=1 Tax=candidate division WWE3 bacterium CG_4_9_14_3_um_filter_34_6 TaxID=1975079 RepID=A0A2M7X486_UNCKA|nr:MAG: hypothetical protein CO178_01265 [candidate division WWE3 bacterium CG_4_9_14_3_um_filter_34_6]
MATLYEKIKDLLDSKKIIYKELHHEAVFTSKEAAKVRNAPIEEGAKALIFKGTSKKAGKIKQSYIQIVIQGNKRVDREKFKSAYDYETLKLVSSDEVKRISGVEPGAVAPFGNLFQTKVKVYVEDGLLDNKEIEFNAGDHKISMRMKTVDWAKLVKPTIGRFAEKEKEEIIKVEAEELPAIVTKKTKKTIHQSAVITVMAIFFAFLSGILISPKLDNVANLLSNSNIQENNPKVEETKEEVLGISSENTESITYKNLPPEISANAYGVFDMKNPSHLYTKNADLPLPPASVTKIMTAIIALEEYSLDEPVVVPSKCVNINGSSVGFSANEVFTLQDMLYALLVKSGADAACSIASIYDETEFIEKMNRKANELGMQKTRFENEIGFDSEKHQFSTVNDLEKLTKYALASGIFRKIVGADDANLRPLNGSSKIYKITNTNELLFTIPGTVGIKTGTTDDAGECLIYLYENKGQEIMIVILGSTDRFGDTIKLLDWAKTYL